MTNIHEYISILENCHTRQSAEIKQALTRYTDIGKKFKESYKKNDIKCLYEVNILDYNGLCETQTSHLIKTIFSYEKDGQYPIWHSFVKRFYSDDLASRIKQPLFSAEEQRIDISVKESGQYAFIFENKLKGAVFQRNQLGRYISLMLNDKYSPENIYVVIIPGYIDSNFMPSIRKSVWKLPKSDCHCHITDSSNNYICPCDIDNTIEECDQCTDFKELINDKDHIKVLDKDFIDWLMDIATSDSCISSDEYLLKSAILQFAHYIKGLYQIRLNSKIIMENIKILEKELALNPEYPEQNYEKVTKMLEDLNGLVESMKRLQGILKIRIWQKEIENNFPDARIDYKEDSFGILINNIYCGIWLNGGNRAYWGFYSNPNSITPSNATLMVSHIVQKTEVQSQGKSGDFIDWNYTERGAEIISNFLNATKELGYKYQQK